jgi:hypothetical protein
MSQSPEGTGAVFIPHGSTCEADQQFPDDNVAHCGEPAAGRVTDSRGVDRMVCATHLRLWKEGKRG